MRRFLILLLFLLAAAPMAQAAPDAEAAKPPLWKLSDEDTTIYLFGTIHLLKPGTVWMTDNVERALNSSDTLYMEVSIAEQQDATAIQALVQKYGMLPKGQTLTGQLPEDGQRLKDGLVGMGLNADAVERFKPWFAGMTFANLKFLQLGYNPAAGVEAALGGLALARGIPVDGLETMEYQLGMFDAMSAEETAVYIKDILDEQDGLQEMMTGVTESWTHGDLKALDDEINDMNDLSPSLAERIVYTRNRNWAVKIRDLLAEPGQFFVAVGSGHFVGEHSVIEYLGDKGLEITRVQ